MALSKKHYEAIALTIKSLLDYEEGQGDFGWNDCRREVAVRLALVFKQDNPRFDPRRFLKACGVETEG